jgi:hypothetical protein
MVCGKTWTETCPFRRRVMAPGILGYLADRISRKVNEVLQIAQDRVGTLHPLCPDGMVVFRDVLRRAHLLHPFRSQGREILDHRFQKPKALLNPFCSPLLFLPFESLDGGGHFIYRGG